MKKVLLFFAIMMMAVTSSYAKVYEIDCTQNKDVDLREPGESVTINGVVITILDGELCYRDPRGGFWDWWGNAKENSFQISTEKGETITHIEITGEAKLLYGTEWTKTATGATWTGSALSVNCGSGILSTKLTVTVDETTAIKNVETTSSQKAGKFIKDGKLVIVKDGKLYNANGQKM